MKLYAYFRSSTSYRVRIALALKGLAPEIIPVNLLKGEQRSEAYRAVNTEGRVPALIDDGHTLTQSLAIMEYIEEKYPSPPILPLAPAERARVRALSLAVACDMSPLNNLHVLTYLVKEAGLAEEQKMQWMHHWFAKGLATLEQLLQHPQTGTFCHGATPTMADCCLVPQVYNALRFRHDMSPYPAVMRIHAACEQLPAFIAAHPSKQPDAI